MSGIFYRFIGFLLCVVLIGIGHVSFSQQVEIVIKNSNALDALWNKIPDNGWLNAHQADLKGGTDPQCASLALKRVKRNINQLGLRQSLKDVVSGGFSALGVVMPGGNAKYVFVAVKMAFKAWSAGSPEEFEEDALKEAIKQAGGAGISVKESEALEKALKEAYKKIIDALFKKGKTDLYNKPLTFDPCENGSVIISREPPTEGDTTMQFTLSFTMDEECDCKYPNNLVSGDPVKLRKYNVWGSMPMTIKQIEYEPVTFHFNGLRKDKIVITLECGQPSYQISADCCQGSQASNNSEVPKNTQVNLANSTLIGFRPNEISIIGGFTHFGEKEQHYNSIGGSVEYTRFFTPRLGATVDVAGYFHTENLDGYSQGYSQFSFTAGATYLPCLHSGDQNRKFTFSTHALFGISDYMEKDESGGYGSVEAKMHSFTMTIGVAADWKVSPAFGIRAPQLDYTPTFFGNETQNNYRIGVGAMLRF